MTLNEIDSKIDAMAQRIYTVLAALLRLASLIRLLLDPTHPMTMNDNKAGPVVQTGSD